MAYTRARGHSSHCDERAGCIDHGAEAFVGLFVSSSNASELLEVAEEVLDEMAPLIHVEVAGDWLFSIGFRRNDNLSAALIQAQPQGVVVESWTVLKTSYIKDYKK